MNQVDSDKRRQHLGSAHSAVTIGIILGNQSWYFFRYFLLTCPCVDPGPGDTLHWLTQQLCVCCDHSSCAVWPSYLGLPVPCSPHPALLFLLNSFTHHSNELSILWCMNCQTYLGFLAALLPLLCCLVCALPAGDGFAPSVGHNRFLAEILLSSHWHLDSSQRILSRNVTLSLGHLPPLIIVSQRLSLSSDIRTGLSTEHNWTALPSLCCCSLLPAAAAALQTQVQITAARGATRRHSPDADGLRWELPDI